MTLRSALASVLLAVLGLPGVPQMSAAQMTPLKDTRYTEAQAEMFGNVQHDKITPTAPFDLFDSTINMLAENPDPNDAGSCSADAFQFSQFFPAAIYGSGGTSGGWDVYDSPYSAASLCSIRFRLDQCAQFQLDAWVDDPGDFPFFPTGYVLLHGPTFATMYHELRETGELHTTGRIAPGEYVLEGRSAFSVNGGLQYVNGATYSFTWFLTPCGTPLIAQQPADAAVPAGAAATFGVVPNGPSGGAETTSRSSSAALTYQWRRNLVPLTDDGHVSGSTTSTLTIHDASDADTAYYDVVVSDGSVDEPSRLARLEISGTAAVEGAPAGPQSALTLFASGPNPFASSTSFRYVAAHPLRATVAIYDVTGARIRTLADGVLEGAGTLAWDGRSAAGNRVPAGVYFLRADAGATHESRRVVLLP